MDTFFSLRLFFSFILFFTIYVKCLAEFPFFQPKEESTLPRWFVDEEKKFVLVDVMNKRISQKKYDFGDYFSDTFAVCVYNNGFCGAVNIYGKEIVPCDYEEVDCHNYMHYDYDALEGVGNESYVIICKKKRKYYAYDNDGNILLEKCSNINNLLRGILLFSKRGHMYLLSIKDKQIYSIKDKKLVFSFFDKNGICMVARVCDENKIRQSYLFGAVDARGKYVVPCIYKKEEEVMAKIGRTERSFKYLNNK